MNGYMGFIEDLKVGDEVVLGTPMLFSVGLEYNFSKVEKITPSGFVKVGGILFYKSGFARGGCGARIFDASIQENRDAVRDYHKVLFVKEIVEKIPRLYRCGNISYEQAVKINEILDDGKGDKKDEITS